uniref:Ig-like domain-containing protein n=1 Tax=Cyclopterus lumpus TaxID=8103 RepID=A0A8C2ZDL2_CYCLU
MTSPTCIFYLTCLFWGEMVQAIDQNFSSSVHQVNRFLSGQTGGNLTLLCFHDDVVAVTFYWYKQTLGEKPRHMSTSYKYGAKRTFHAEFKNPRFTLDVGTIKNHLRITDLQISDSATYYCASSSSYKFDFMEGIVVSVKGSGLNVPVLVHQSASETIQPGGSVTLNCTVHTGTCDGQHSVYWFKDSEESHPGLIYTHGGRNDQCERKPSTQTHTCSYNLPMTLSDAGTYYCAVASCGRVLFGDGTKLDFEDELHSVLWVTLLSGALTFTTILSVLLALSVCMMNKGNSCQSTGNSLCLYLATCFHLIWLLNKILFLFCNQSLTQDVQLPPQQMQW